MIKSLLYIALGSAMGGCLRYLISRYIHSAYLSTFPIATFFVNILGCFLIGAIYAVLERENIMSVNLRLFLTVGFCGGFTTFSTFIHESVQLLKSEDIFMLIANLSLSIILGFLAFFIGNIIFR